VHREGKSDATPEFNHDCCKLLPGTAVKVPVEVKLRNHYSKQQESDNIVYVLRIAKTAAHVLECSPVRGYFVEQEPRLASSNVYDRDMGAFTVLNNALIGQLSTMSHSRTPEERLVRKMRTTLNRSIEVFGRQHYLNRT
jgi:hypothetical protein